MSDFDESKIKVVFMDIGGVILTNGWDHHSRQKAAKVFGYDYEKMETLHQFVFYVFEIGHISLDDYLDMTIFREEKDFSRQEFKDFMFGESKELPKTLEWLKSWKKTVDIPVFALSNESTALNDYRIQKFELHQVFDGFFSSCYVGYRKPDPRIFEKALQLTQVSKAECVYFDDRKNMVETARSYGWNAIHHQDFETSKEILKKFKSK